MTREDYRLLDSGHGRKLEAFGEVVLDRPVAYAIWPPSRPRAEWEAAHGVYHRSETGGGSWTWREKPPTSWPIGFGGLTLTIKPTPFGHLGLFSEQRGQWDWLRQVAREGMEVLNLFAYTGGSTLATAAVGARVVHLDASQGAVSWARENAGLNDLAARPIRWIVEDAARFVAREERRGHRYHGIVLDPPSFGRGAKGEVFKIEDDLPGLLAGCLRLIGDDPAFVLLSCHSAGFTPEVLARVLAAAAPAHGGKLESGEMTVPEVGGRLLPSGVFARWSRR